MPSIASIGAIDAGSNAIRVVVASIGSTGAVTKLEVERMPVRLGRRAFTHGELDPATIEAAAGAFSRIRTLFDRHGVQAYRAVGTSALRTAQNRDLLLRRIEHEAGIEIDIIEGEEEARLVRLAVLEAFRDREPPRLLFDLGGGSLEVSVRTAEGEWWVTSRPIGTVRLLETFGLDDAINEDEARMVKRYVRSLLRMCERELGEHHATGVDPAVACGGNAEALANILGDRDERGMAFIDVEKLRALVTPLTELTVSARMERYGFGRDRAEVIGIAALALVSTAKAFRVRRFWVPSVGVREGLLLELSESLMEGKSSNRGAREQSLLSAARNFAARLGHHTQHGENVRRVARMLFDQLAKPLGLNAELGIVLEVAAVLHDIGEVVNRSGHHKHSEYLIRTGRIPGLDSPYREIVAAVARGHRKSTPDPRKHWSFGELDTKRRAEARALLAILRLADCLDTDHRGRINAISTTIRDKQLELVLHQQDAGPESNALLLRKAGLLEELLDVRASVKVLSTPHNGEIASA
jgi:exopolyphosphatase/guanosine-5'-triphosphate,3'-diphosphate pyrophosphatase